MKVARWAMMNTHPDLRTRDPEVLRRAVEAMLDIAWEDDPPAMVQSLHEQIDQLAPSACAQLLEDMVDTDVVDDLLASMEDGDGFEAAVPAFGPEEMAKVDAALAPLAHLTRGPEAAASVGRLSPAQRAHMLMSAIGRRQG